MRVDHLPPEAQAEIQKLHSRLLIEVQHGMVHGMERHGMRPITVSDDICEDAVIVICGRKVFERIQAVNNEQLEVKANAEALQAVAKAMQG